MTGGPTEPGGVVHRFTGVYDADGSIVGEVRYVVGRVFGRRHCALCDITHGAVRVKPSWADARAKIPVPFEAVHRDQRSPELEAVTAGATPCVVAHTDDDLQVVLGASALEACHGDPDLLVAALTAAIERRGLRYPARPASEG